MITPFYSKNLDLLIGTEKSALNSASNKADTTISIYSIQKFATDQILWIGEPGEGSEIIKTHSSTDPNANTVTLATPLTKNHTKDTPVYIIPYDQVEFSHSETETGVKSVLETYTIDSERDENRHDESNQTTGFVFTRFKNSLTGGYSSYSDPFPFAGLEMNTVGYLVQDASEGIDPDNVVTFERKIRIINQALRFIRGKLKRWSNFQEFDYIVDQTERGKYEYDLPSTMYNLNSNKSVLTVRIGDGESLKYMDKRELVDKMARTVHTAVATAPTIGDTSLVLDNTYDLPDSGTIHIFSSGTLYEVTYTTNTRSTGTLSGIEASGDGSITVAFSVDTSVWYGEEEGEPVYFTVYDGKLAIHPMPDDDYDNKNIFMDFYTDIVEVDSESDIISFERYDMLYNYLRWEIRNKAENKEKKDYNDGDYFMFKEILTDAIRKECSGQKYKMKPKINRIADNRTNKLSFDRA